MNAQARLIRPSKGAALIVGFILAILLLAMALTYASRMSSNQLRSESDIAGDRAYESAQTANTLKIQKVWAEFKSKPPAQRIAWASGEDANGNGVLDPGEDANGNGLLDLAHAPDCQDSNWVDTSSGATCTRIKVLSFLKNQWAIVRFTTWAQVKDDLRGYNVVRKVQRAVRFSIQPSAVFDYAFFIDNYAAIDGDKINIYGPVGANGNITLSNNPLIDGKLFAAKNPNTGAAGLVQGGAQHESISHYQDSMSHNRMMRPTNPTAPPEDANNNGLLDAGEDRNKNGILDTFKYAPGYDGTQTIATMQNPAVMPELGDLSMSKDAANSFVRPSRPDLGEAGGVTGGVIKQLTQPGLDPTDPANYTVLINRTYGDNGENGMMASASGKSITYTSMPNKIETNPANGWKNGNVTLIGTADQPLVILGPVVVTNDLVIKGMITGQGSIYVGRNLHVVGDLTYKNPPQWSTNDINFDTTAAVNKTKDAVGFNVRGNIVLGNYTDMDTNSDEWGSIRKMMTPPYIKPELVTNLPDASIGYGNGSSGSPFNGDFTQLDSGKMYLDDNTAPTASNRAYYQSTFPKAYIKSITNTPQTMHGIFYAGHFFGGRGDYLTLFGSLIARDEGLLDDWAINLVYDTRVSQTDPSTYVNLSLPGVATIETMYWKDMPADDAVSTSPDW